MMMNAPFSFANLQRPDLRSLPRPDLRSMIGSLPRPILQRPGMMPQQSMPQQQPMGIPQWLSGANSAQGALGGKGVNASPMAQKWAEMIRNR